MLQCHIPNKKRKKMQDLEEYFQNGKYIEEPSLAQNIIEISVCNKSCFAYSIQASRIGDLLSDNKHYNNKYFLYIWQKTLPDDYKKRFERYGPDVINLMKGSNKSIQNYNLWNKYAISQRITILSRDVNLDMFAESKQMLSDISTREKIPSTQLVVLHRSIQSEFMRRLGSRMEKNDLDKFEEIYSMSNMTRPKHIISKPHYVHTEDCVICLYLNGQTDAICADTVIDTKRVSIGLTKNIPFQSYVQLYIYMFILNISNASLVQWYKTTHKVFPVKLNDQICQDMMMKIAHKRHGISEMLKSTKYKQKFMKSNYRKR
jgi:hypothetical protein